MSVSQSRSVLVILVIAVSLFARDAIASPSPQWKPSKSDADITAIGHRNIARGTNLYSLEKEKALGNQLAKQFEQSTRLVDDPAITGYVDRVGQKLAQNSDAGVPVTFLVVDTDSVSSFTLPGGHQYVSRGLLLQLGEEAELAGVLAHGIAQSALRSGATAVSPRAGGTTFQVPPTFLEKARENVLAADYFGLQYVYVTGYDPEPYTHLIERGVWPEVSRGKAVPKELSPFPPAPERFQAMQKEIVEILPRRDGSVVSTPEFDAFKERVRAWKLGQRESKQPDKNE